MASNVNLAGLTRLKRALAAGSANPAMRAMYAKWGDRYLLFSHTRYTRNSRGGSWAPLAPLTLANRRARGSTSNAILIDRGNLVSALVRGVAGNLFQFLPNGIRAGFNDRDPHPDAKISYAQLAVIQGHGTSRIPARPIIVLPDAATRAGIAADARNTIQLIGRGP